MTKTNATNLTFGDWHPTDELGFEPFVDMVYNRISEYREECRLRPRKIKFLQRVSNFFKGENINIDQSSFTIGIFGEWGSGKTTFLRMLAKRLEGDKVSTVFLNAWRFNQEEELWKSLLQELLISAPSRRNIIGRAYIKIKIWFHSIDFKRGSWEIIKKIIIPFLKTSIVLLLFALALKIEFAVSIARFIYPSLNKDKIDLLAKALLGFSGFLVLGPTKVVKLFQPKLNLEIKKFLKHNFSDMKTNFLSSFRSQFQWLIDSVYNGKPLIIFIDDLDRCRPEKAIEILEAIKLFLDVDRCVFILGVNKEIITDAVLSQYHHLFKSKPLEEGERSKESIGVSIADFGASYIDRITQYSFTIPPLDEATKKHFIKTLLPEENSEDEVVEIFTKGLKGNPRKIKHAIHAYISQLEYHHKSQDEENLKE